MTNQPRPERIIPKGNMPNVEEDNHFFWIAVPDSLSEANLPPRRSPSKVQFLQDSTGAVFIRTDILISLSEFEKQLGNEDITFMPESAVEAMCDASIDCTYPEHLVGEWEYSDE